MFNPENFGVNPYEIDPISRESSSLSIYEDSISTPPLSKEHSSPSIYEDALESQNVSIDKNSFSDTAYKMKTIFKEIIEENNLLEPIPHPIIYEDGFTYEVNASTTKGLISNGSYGEIFISSLDKTKIVKKSSWNLIKEYIIGVILADFYHFTRSIKLFIKLKSSETEIDYVCDKNTIYKLICEKVEGKTLEFATEWDKKKVAIQLTECFFYTVKKNIMWSEIKQDNMMINEKGDLKLIDYGTYRFFNKNELSTQLYTCLFYFKEGLRVVFGSSQGEIKNVLNKIIDRIKLVKNNDYFKKVSDHEKESFAKQDLISFIESIKSDLEEL